MSFMNKSITKLTRDLKGEATAVTEASDQVCNALGMHAKAGAMVVVAEMSREEKEEMYKEYNVPESHQNLSGKLDLVLVAF